MRKYLHKDFHSALSVCMDHVRRCYGDEVLKGYLREIGRNCYADLIARIRQDGLAAWKDHLTDALEAEEADYELCPTEDGFDLAMRSCPALEYMRKHKMKPCADFCLSTSEVQGAIAEAAGVRFSVIRDSEAGECLQRFRRSVS